jgi:hypothetical protein
MSTPFHGDSGRPMREIAIDTSATAGDGRRDGERRIVELGGAERDRLLAEYGRLYLHRRSVLERTASLEGELRVVQAVMMATGGVDVVDGGGLGGTDLNVGSMQKLATAHEGGGMTKLVAVHNAIQCYKTQRAGI